MGFKGLGIGPDTDSGEFQAIAKGRKKLDSGGACTVVMCMSGGWESEVDKVVYQLDIYENKAEAVRWASKALSDT